jgi:cellulose biosynthesis protein BcsQ
VSGKGGVGKTMLSVAVARELSLNNRTLIVDLDFFNRGLTGLMSKGEITCQVDKPAFLLDKESDAAPKWIVTKVAENLFNIAYPDLLPEEMQRFETLDVNILRDSLKAFIEEASEKCQCECVVLDCHGGPDNSSFAACLLADYSLLVSEPDRITFYGTLNFLRQLKRIGGEQQVDLHLVFNKVVPAFSGLFLRSLYNRLIREHFSGRPLLAIFPLEVYLTKEFEKTPFLTAVYPYSWLAKKTRALLGDLMSLEHADTLPPTVRATPKWARAYTRLSLGKQLPLLNMNVVMLTVVGVVVFLALVALSLSQFFPNHRQRFREDVASIAMLQCLDQSNLLISNPDAVKEKIEHPSADSPVMRRLLEQQLQESRKLNQEYGDLQDSLFDVGTKGQGDTLLRLKDRKNLERIEEELKRNESNLIELTKFRDCASPDASFALGPEYWRSRLRYEDFLADENLDSISQVQSQNVQVSNDLIFAKRREVLNSLKVASVPKDYLGLYRKKVQNLENMSLIYLALQAISEVVFSPSGSRSLAIAGGSWLGLVLLFTWSGQLDRKFTYYSRLRRFASLMGPYLVAIVLWFLPLLGVGAIIKKLAPFFRESPTNRWVQFEIIMVIAVPMLILAGGQIIRLYRDLRYDKLFMEGLLRAVFLLYFMFGPLAMYLLFMR